MTETLLTPTEAPSSDAPPLRQWLTVKEYAAALDISYSTLRKQIDKAFHSVDGFPFPGGPDNPHNPWYQPIEEILLILGPSMRRFDLRAIELDRYPSEVRARILRLAAEPRTDGRTAGRRRTLLPAPTSPRGLRRGGTSHRILEIIASDPNRAWSLAEIIGALDERGQLPPESKTDRRALLQAALFRLTWKTGHIEPAGFCLYRLAPHRPPVRFMPPAAPKPHHRVSDLSGDPIPHGKGARVEIIFTDLSRGVRELYLTNAEADTLGGRRAPRLRRAAPSDRRT